MKRTFCILLIMAMLLAAVNFNALALTEGDWEYKIFNNEITITRYNGNDTEVVVPSTIRGCPVVKLEINDGDSTRNIVSLTLPDTIRELGENALYGSSNLTYINFPKSLKTLGKHSVVAPGLKFADLSNVEKMGIGAMSGCGALEEVILSNKLTEIPDYAFQSTNLKAISIPKSVKRIGQYAFANNKLETVIVPGTVKKVGHNAFGGNDYLKEVVFCHGVEVLEPDAVFGDYGTVGWCDSLEAVYIPSTVKSFTENIIIHSDNAIIYCAKNSYAESYCREHEISYLIDNSVDTQVNVLNNGSRISFHKYGQNPIIENGRTLIPLRAIFEALDAKVGWDGATRTVTATKGNTKISLQIGSNKMYVNGQVKTLDVPAKIINGSTLVPARAVAEAFNCNVGWDDNSKTVIITE